MTLLLTRGGIEEDLESCLLINKIQHYIYGPHTYCVRGYRLHLRVAATLQRSAHNIYTFFVAVDWNYKDLNNMWTANNFARLLMVRRLPLSTLYVAFALLLNFKTCVENGGKVGSYFQCAAR